jgi:hypothetical protein
MATVANTSGARVRESFTIPETVCPDAYPAKSINRQPKVILIIAVFPGKIVEKPGAKRATGYFPQTI